jgi:predicted RNA-binding protein with RPS1 domain
VVDGVVTRIADFGVFVQIEDLIEGLMHVSETPLPRGAKPQEHYHEGDPIRVRILRIDEAEMKVGLSGLDEAGQPLGAAEPVAAAPSPPAEPEPAVEPAPAESGESAEAEAAPKKRRTRKKAEEPKA